jgi:hypothetical protein
LRDVLCVQVDRQVGRDNCVSWVRIPLILISHSGRS